MEKKPECDRSWELIFRIEDHLREVFAEKCPEEVNFYAGLTLGQARAVRCLQGLKRDGVNDVTLKMLAEKLNVSSAAASEAVESLVRKNVLVRQQSTSDRRAVKLDFSEESNRRIELARETLAEYWSDYAASLSEDERAKLFELLSKIAGEIK